MSEVRKILSEGRSYELEEAQVPTDADLDELESAIRASLPSTYREFIVLGGLAELGFEQQILPPLEVAEALASVPPGFVPFAANGCGDLFCWRAAELPASPAFFWDHETGAIDPYSESFLGCLRKWRHQ